MCSVWLSVQLCVCSYFESISFTRSQILSPHKKLLTNYRDYQNITRFDVVIDVWILIAKECLLDWVCVYSIFHFDLIVLISALCDCWRPCFRVTTFARSVRNISADSIYRSAKEWTSQCLYSIRTETNLVDEDTLRLGHGCGNFSLANASKIHVCVFVCVCTCLWIDLCECMICAAF